MKVRFGTSLLSWITPLWTPEGGRYAIEKSAAAGFDLLEILLPNTMDFDAATVKGQLRKNGLDVVCSLNLPKAAHIPFHPKEALILINKALDCTAALDTDSLSGVLHSAIGVFTGQPVTDQEKETIVNVLGEAAVYASRLGITIGIEPINRYESYVCNTAANVLELIHKIDMANLAVHLDTFHMNIEERNFHAPVILAGALLKHVHITESNRGMPGEGTVNWMELFNALNAINFNGNLVLENFSSSIPGMQQAVSLWQQSPHHSDDLAIGSLKFLKDQVSLFN
ncbi:sugar phosphate isomerase/epimerase family protein [Pedobacter sp. PWIIR3]